MGPLKSPFVAEELQVEDEGDEPLPPLRHAVLVVFGAFVGWAICKVIAQHWGLSC